MESVKIIALLCCVTALAESRGENNTPGLAENLEWLRAKVQELENKDRELEKTSLALKEENQGLRDMLSMMRGMRDSFVGFDCYRSDDWVEAGTITYDGCSVDTTAGNPASGNFVVGEQGPYRVVKLNFTTEIEVLMHMD